MNKVVCPPASSNLHRCRPDLNVLPSDHIDHVFVFPYIRITYNNFECFVQQTRIFPSHCFPWNSAHCLTVDLCSLSARPAGEKPFNCPSDGCEKTFSSQYSLKSHIRGHDKGQPFTVTLSHPLSEVSHGAAARHCLPCRHGSSGGAQPRRNSAPCLSFR